MHVFFLLFESDHGMKYQLIWLVGFGFNGPLRQFFSLYRAVSQKRGRKRRKDR